MATMAHTQNKSVVYKAKQAVLVVRIQWVIFLGMIFASIVPIIALYMLTERNLLQQEIASVDENHLIIARNLEAAIDRYTNDVASVLVLVSSDLNGFKDQETNDILDDFDIQTVALFNAEGSLENEVSGARYPPKPLATSPWRCVGVSRLLV
jgi:predicted class III extradiol MEMO1 family dioxygenase